MSEQALKPLEVIGENPMIFVKKPVFKTIHMMFLCMAFVVPYSLEGNAPLYCSSTIFSFVVVVMLSSFNECLVTERFSKWMIPLQCLSVIGTLIVGMTEVKTYSSLGIMGSLFFGTLFHIRDMNKVDEKRKMSKSESKSLLRANDYKDFRLLALSVPVILSIWMTAKYKDTGTIMLLVQTLLCFVVCLLSKKGVKGLDYNSIILTLYCSYTFGAFVSNSSNAEEKWYYLSLALYTLFVSLTDFTGGNFGLVGWKRNIKSIEDEQISYSRVSVLISALTAIAFVLTISETYVTMSLDVGDDVVKTSNDVVSNMKNMTTFMEISQNPETISRLGVFASNVQRYRFALMFVSYNYETVLSARTSFENKTSLKESALLLLSVCIYLFSILATLFKTTYNENIEQHSKFFNFKLLTSSSLFFLLTCNAILLTGLVQDTNMVLKFSNLYWVYISLMSLDVVTSLIYSVKVGLLSKKARFMKSLKDEEDFMSFGESRIARIFIDVVLFALVLTCILMSWFGGAIFEKATVSNVNPFLPEIYRITASDKLKYDNPVITNFEAINNTVVNSPVAQYMSNNFPGCTCGQSFVPYNDVVQDIQGMTLVNFIQHQLVLNLGLAINGTLANSFRNLTFPDMEPIDNMIDYITQGKLTTITPDPKKSTLMFLSISLFCFAFGIRFLSITETLVFRQLEKMFHIILVTFVLGIVLSVNILDVYLPTAVFLKYTISSNGQIFMMGVVSFIALELHMIFTKPKLSRDDPLLPTVEQIKIFEEKPDEEKIQDGELTTNKFEFKYKDLNDEDDVWEEVFNSVTLKDAGFIMGLFYDTKPLSTCLLQKLDGRILLKSKYMTRDFNPDTVKKIFYSSDLLNSDSRIIMANLVECNFLPVVSKVSVLEELKEHTKK